MYYVANAGIHRQVERGRKKASSSAVYEKAIGGLPQYDSIEAMIAKMDEAGVEKVFITQCKMWSYRNKWMYMDTTLDEVAQYTKRYPNRFVGLASYNPFRIKESLQELEQAIKVYGFKGVYIHIYGFDIPLHDAKMYPLYAKCVELNVPVSMQVGHVLEAMPSEHARPIYLDRIASDFPELKIIGAHTGWPWVEELISVCYKWDNVYFGVDAWMPKYMKLNHSLYQQPHGPGSLSMGDQRFAMERESGISGKMGLKEATKKKLCTITPCGTLRFESMIERRPAMCRIFVSRL